MYSDSDFVDKSTSVVHPFLVYKSKILTTQLFDKLMSFYFTAL